MIQTLNVAPTKNMREKIISTASKCSSSLSGCFVAFCLPCVSTSLGGNYQRSDSNQFLRLVCAHISLCLSGVKWHEWSLQELGSPAACVKTKTKVFCCTRGSCVICLSLESEPSGSKRTRRLKRKQRRASTSESWVQPFAVDLKLLQWYKLQRVIKDRHEGTVFSVIFQSFSH